MRRYAKYLTVCIMVLAVVLGVTTMKVSAAEVRTGILGENGKVQYTYDESTKTLTLTGSDSGLGETDYYKDTPIYSICPDVEIIVLKDFKPIGDTGRLFDSLAALKEVKMEKFDTSAVTNMYSWFYGCESLTTLDVSEFNTSNVVDMGLMFYLCGNLTSLDVSGFDTKNVVCMDAMFAGCENLTSLNVSGFNTSKVTSMNSMFSNCSSLNALDVSRFDTSNVKNMAYMFSSCVGLTSLDVSGFDTSNVTDMSTMFGWCENLSNLDVSGFDTKNVTNMSKMFAYCNCLDALDVSEFDTSKVTDMSSMFLFCANIEELDVSNFKTLNVAHMDEMFAGCRSLISMDASEFEMSNVIDLEKMFAYCDNLKSLDVKGWDTGKVTDMQKMFFECYSIDNLDLSDWDTSNVKDMNCMFIGCRSLSNLNVKGWNTENVTKMTQMFQDCRSLNTIDITSWDTKNVDEMHYMFWNCSNLSSLDISHFDITKWPSMVGIVEGCYYLSYFHVPKVIPEGFEIDLQLKLKDASGKQVSYLTSEHSNMILTRDAISIVSPVMMYGGESTQLQIKINGQVKGVSENQNYNWTIQQYYDVASISETGVLQTVKREGFITIILSDKDTDEVLAESTVYVVIPQKPIITTQPMDVLTSEGATAVFKVVAAGSNLTYRWQYKPAGSTQWFDSGMTGSNTDSLNVVATAARNEYQYRCVIKDKDGNKVTSNPAKLTVVKAIDISGQPASATVNEGEKVTFKVEAKGNNLTYQWQFKSATATYWTDSSMAGSKTNSITVEATSARNNYQYRCVVKDANGNKATTDAAKLTVEKSIEISGQPASASVSEGAKVTFKVDAKGTGLTYQWQFKSATATYWTNSTMAGSKTNSITVEATAARNGYQYRCVVKDAGGSKVTTDAAKLTVTKSIEITGQPASASVSEGAKVTFKVDAKGTGLTYQWQFKSATATYWTNSTMAGSKTNSITVEATAARNGYQYRCVVKDTGGSKVTTEAAKLTVTKSIEISGQPASASVSEGEKVTFKVEAKGTGLTYQWQFKSATATYWTNSTMAGSKTNSITLEATSARNGYQYRCVVKDAGGSKVTTEAAKLTVNKSIEITAQPASATVAEGASATFKVEAKGTGLTYQWQFKSASSSFWADSSMAGSKTGSITVTATTARNGYQYRCVVKDANGSKVTTNAAKLTVQ